MGQSNYLLIASDLPPLEGPKMPALEVFQLMQRHSCWEFPAQSGQARLREGDRVFFYLGSKVRRIVGEAEVAGPALAIQSSTPATFDRNRFPFFVWRMPMRNFLSYQSETADLDFLMELSFARNSTVTRPYVGLLLRVGMRSLTEEDVKLIHQRVQGSPAASG